MPTYRAVLFDFFGTLTRAVQRGPQHATIARRLGCDPDRMAEVLNRSFCDRAGGAFGGPVSTLRWVCAQAGGRPTTELLRRGLAARIAAVAADTRLRPDAIDTLRGLRRRDIRTCVVSDCGYELPVFLPRLPISPLLDARIYSVEVGRRKPHPAMYLTACERLRVEPEECLYIGDGGSRELTGAAAVGMTAVRLVTPDLAGHLRFDPDDEWRGATAGSLCDAAALIATAPADTQPLR